MNSNSVPNCQHVKRTRSSLLFNFHFIWKKELVIFTLSTAFCCEKRYVTNKKKNSLLFCRKEATFKIWNNVANLWPQWPILSQASKIVFEKFRFHHSSGWCHIVRTWNNTPWGQMTGDLRREKRRRLARCHLGRADNSTAEMKTASVLTSPNNMSCRRNRVVSPNKQETFQSIRAQVALNFSPCSSLLPKGFTNLPQSRC